MRVDMKQRYTVYDAGKDDYDRYNLVFNTPVRAKNGTLSHHGITVTKKREVKYFYYPASIFAATDFGESIELKDLPLHVRCIFEEFIV